MVERVWLQQGIVVVACTFVAALGSAGAARAQFSSMPDGSRAILEGNWQSCREADGHYSERVYDNDLPDIGPFELHLGPYHQFALFRGVQEAHREHTSPENLLRPHVLEVVGNRSSHVWEVAGLRLEVALGGGADQRCESWFVTLERAPSRSSD